MGNFTWIQITGIIGTIQGFFLAFFLFYTTKKQKKYERNQVLSILTGLVSIALLGRVFYFPIYQSFPHLGLHLEGFVFVYMLLLYLYVCKTLDIPPHILRPKRFIPLLIYILLLFSFWRYTPKEVSAMIANRQLDLLWLFTEFSAIVFNSIYGLLIFRKIYLKSSTPQLSRVHYFVLWGVAAGLLWWITGFGLGVAGIHTFWATRSYETMWLIFSISIYLLGYWELYNSHSKKTLKVHDSQ